MRWPARGKKWPSAREREFMSLGRRVWKKGGVG